MPTVGFIGLGNMGSRIANRLLQAGHGLVVHDASPAALKPFAGRGVVLADSPRDAASIAPIVFVCLPTPEVVRQVALGPGGIGEGTRVRIYVDLSTTGPVVAQEVGAGLAAKGIACLDSPVSGGLGGAEKGTLALMVAGPAAAAREVAPLLRSFGTPTLVSETVGLGQMMKLLNNLLSGTAIAVTAEAMVLGVKAGLDPQVMLRVLNLGSGRNCATEERIPNHVLDRSFANGFANALMHKDVQLCLAMAEKLQVPLWVGTTVHRMWMQAVLDQGADAGTTTIVKMIEGWAGVEVKADPAFELPAL